MQGSRLQQHPGKHACPDSASASSGWCEAQKGALSTAEMCEALGLSQMKNRRWHVQGAVAIRGELLGLDW